MNFSRRNFLVRSGVGMLAAAGLITRLVPVRAACQRISGAGSYQLGPFPPVQRGGDPVYIDTELGFDETMFFCKIVTNFAALRFGTARMGTVELGAHELWMNMQSVSVERLVVEEGSDGPVASFGGLMRSETRLFSGDKTKTFIEEDIPFGCEAVSPNGGTQVEISKANFSMTVQFNPLKEHAAIFGDSPTFAGQLTQGNIIISL